MATLCDHDWLPQAKRLAVGMRMRIRHGHERRPNLTIANERDRWWAYCQACKVGGKLMKEHVLLGEFYKTEERTLEVPTDRIPVIGSDYERAVGAFLASKGMMFPYLPGLYVSPSTRRLLMQDDDGRWHGRDLSGRSNQKWLHYGTQFVGTPGDDIAVVTEDLFSMFKVRYATGLACVCSTLGSSCGPVGALALAYTKGIVWFYDGDEAGDKGFVQASKRMRPFSPRQTRARPPEGQDPKDMDCASINELVMEAICRVR